MRSSNLHECLTRSLRRQRKVLGASIILTPVDSIPLFYDNQEAAGFLHGLYISDKQKTEAQQAESIIQFGGRKRATRDLNLIYKLFAKQLGAAEGSLRLLSGLHAHIAIFMILAGIGDSVLLLPEEAGGHFATKRILQRLGLRVIDMAVDFNRLCIDRARTLKIVQAEKPDFIFVDRSEGLRYEDFRFLGELKGSIKIFDASQYLPQIMYRRYINPFDWGFDLLVFTVHKSFPGPQKAGIVSREPNEIWIALQKGLGELVSNAHPESSYRTGLTLAREQQLDSYVSRLIETSLGLERHLLEQGVPVFCRDSQGHPSWPPTHHLWITLPSQKTAFAFYRALSHVRIQTNYRLLPYKLGWGIRLGTSAATIRGLTLRHVDSLAAIIAKVLRSGASLATRHKLRQLVEVMQEDAMTCWPAESRSRND